MWKTQFTILVIFVAIGARPGWADVSVDGVMGDDHVSLVYDPTSGNLSLDTAGQLVTTLEVVSASGTVFTATQPPAVTPPFGVYRPDKFFVLKETGMGDTDFGPAAAPGLSPEFLADDLTIDGSVAPNGPLPGGGDLVYLIPEPSALSLLLVGIVAGLGICRANRS